MASDGKLGPVRVWALSAGGMVGGGIYIALGVVIAVAGQWAWASFLLAGVVAVISAFSYGRLSSHFGKSGGAFEFLEEMDRRSLAGSLSWLLMIGYTLTISVYVYAFGHYVAYAFGGGEMLIRGLGAGAGILLIGLNLAGLGKMTSVEVVIVSVNLLVLLVLAIWGMSEWSTPALTAGIEPRPPSGALVGAAAIFVSYEGFQLLTYEYDEIRDAKRVFTPILASSAIFVVLVYIAVTLGGTMLAGALTVVDRKQIALSIAAEEAAGTAGLVVMTIAAGFATAAAINSTLFSTAKLAARVARDGELAAWFDHENGQGVPDRPVVLIGILATAMALIGSLSSLVEAASLVFLATFVVVNVVCAREMRRQRAIPIVGAVLGGIIGVVLLARLAVTAPIPLAILLVLAALVFLGRPLVLKRVRTEGSKDREDGDGDASDADTDEEKGS
ncbi:MAG: amino acid permease [Sandaracinus sp.]|nr:amino acid permease [Sandaracinus sp.]